MKMTVNEAVRRAEEMLKNDKRLLHEGAEEIDAKDWKNKRVYINAKCFTLNGRYKGKVDMGYIDMETGEYVATRYTEIDLTDEAENARWRKEVKEETTEAQEETTEEAQEETIEETIEENKEEKMTSKKAIRKIANKYGMQILRNPVTDEGRGLWIRTETEIPELEELADRIEPDKVQITRECMGPVIEYKVITPTNWFDLWGWTGPEVSETAGSEAAGSEAK